MEQTQLTTDCLIIREKSMGESDKLLTVLSRELGVISVYASGAKSIKSKKGAATSLLSYSSLTLKKKGEYFRVTEASPIEVFFKTGDDIEALALAQYFCELAIYHAPSDDSSEQVLRLLLNSLYFLSERKRNIFLIKAIVELRFLSIIGYMPNLVACNKCLKYENDIMYFDMVEGCLYCTHCESFQRNFARINMSLVMAMRYIVFSEFNKLFSFNLTDEAAKVLSKISERYLINKTENNFKTLQFFNSLF